MALSLSGVQLSALQQTKGIGIIFAYLLLRKKYRKNDERKEVRMNGRYFELPVEGASGYAVVETELRKEPALTGKILEELHPGDGFTILKIGDQWWHVEFGGKIGWLLGRWCMINLPDVVPSILYDDTNAYSSVFRSSGRAIPGITGEQLYQAKTYNPRLGREEFITPALFPLAEKLAEAQAIALSNGDCLKVCECYRPYSAQEKVVRCLSRLSEEDSQVRAGIDTPPWELEWFIAPYTSNHQQGYAVDLSLVKILEKRETVIKGRTIVKAEKVEEYTMQTPFHELSMASAAYAHPFPSANPDWQQAEGSPAMTDGAKRLQRWCTRAGLTPLASEWWHFNDLEAMEQTKDRPGEGRYHCERCYSR